MANEDIGHIEALSKAVDDLTKKITSLTQGFEKMTTTATSGGSKMLKSFNAMGGSTRLGQASSRPGTGADNANGLPATGFMSNLGVSSNQFTGSMGGFSYGNLLANVGSGMAGLAKMALAPVAGGYAAMPSASDVLTRASGYYQAGLYGGVGTSRATLQNQTLSALGGGLSYAGSDAAVAAILTQGIGMAPGSFGYTQAVQQVGGASKYLGMGNAQAAAAIGGLQTGQMGANLYQYGINTINPTTGAALTTGQIAQQLYKRIFVNGATKSQVQSSLEYGFAGANLANMGLSSDQQTIFKQAFLDIASGQNPDLASKTTSSAGAGNTNPLAGQMAISSSTTDLMQDSESGVIKGFNQAAEVVTKVNTELSKFATSLGYLRGLIGGIGGSNVGAGAATAGGLLASGAKSVLGAAGNIVGGIVGSKVASKGILKGIESFMTKEVIPNLGKVATFVEANPEILAVGGGGPVGYGASISGTPQTSSGETPPVQGMISAGFNSKGGGGIWNSTQGVHKGLDYAVPVGSPVKASMGGTVSGMPLSADYGTAIVVNGTDGLQYIYGHLSQKLVRLGQTIQAGELIGKSGQTGNCTGPCLHFEVRNGSNNPIDPSLVLGNAATGATGASGGPGSYSQGFATSSGGKVVPVTGSGSQQSAAKALLSALGAPTNKTNIQDLTTWFAAEGGNWHNTASYNPLNTTLRMPGSSSIANNSAGVQAYSSWKQGIAATVSTLTGGGHTAYGYDPIVEALKSGKTSTQSFAQLVNKSSWGTHIGGGPVGYGASIPSMSTGGSGSSPVYNKTVVMNISSSVDAVTLAKQVRAQLSDYEDVSMAGGK